jgi:hypothetical protein
MGLRPGITSSTWSLLECRVRLDLGRCEMPWCQFDDLSTFQLFETKFGPMILLPITLWYFYPLPEVSTCGTKIIRLTLQ